VVLRYLLALCLVAIATVITRSLEPVLGETISPFFFAAVMLSAWTGGLGPGLVATAAAGWASAYFFPNNPPGSTLFSWDDAIRMAVFLMVSVLISSLTSLRKRAQDALRRSYEQLEQRVEQRTAELQATNERLRESEERFRTLVEGVKDYAIVMLDTSGRVVSWNAGAERIQGYPDEEVIGGHVSRFFPDDESEKNEPMRHLQVAETQGRYEDEGWRVRKDGKRFWANVITTALRNESGGLRGFAQITRDITELRKLERDVLQISEAEQRRIGHDLHDGLGQELTGLALLSQSLADRMFAEEAEQAQDVQRLAALITAALEQTRHLAHGFSPIELGPQALPEALRNLATKIEMTTKLPCPFTCEGNATVDDGASLHLYRIAQEALNNAVRHGGATALALSLQEAPGAVVLSVRDNGIGFRIDERQGSGMGLGVMRYRASMIGAKLQIQTGENGGTIVSCTYAARHSPADLQFVNSPPVQPNAELMSESHDEAAIQSPSPAGR
jgi:PAS domain S-box-containing protein